MDDSQPTLMPMSSSFWFAGKARHQSRTMGINTRISSRQASRKRALMRFGGGSTRSWRPQFRQAILMAELCRQHLSELPVPPGARVGKSFDPELESLLMRCLEKDPLARPQSARELTLLLSGCSLAGQWTPEHRAAWWIEHRKSVAGLTKPVSRPGSSQVDKTVKIEFADRTP